jgi:hypothetical protein
VYLNGKKVGAGQFDRPEGHTTFQWGMYPGKKAVKHDPMIFVTGTTFQSSPGSRRHSLKARPKG